MGEARTALAKPDPSAAAIAVRGAQQAVGQVGQLLAAIDKVAVDLPALGERLKAATDDTRADIAEARTAEGATQALTPSITEAERVLTEAATQDPATALAAVERTNVALNQALSGLRDQQAQVARAAAQLPRVTAEAQGAVEAARDYITTRRGAVGARGPHPPGRGGEPAHPGTRADRDRRGRRARGRTAGGLAGGLCPLDGAGRGLGVPVARRKRLGFDSSGSGSGYSNGGSGGAVLGGILDSLFSGSGLGRILRRLGSSGRARRLRRLQFVGRGRPAAILAPAGPRRNSSGRRSRGGRF